MSELMIAVALWCGQVLVHNGIYIKPQATTAQVDQCRKDIIDCMGETHLNNLWEGIPCFENEKLPGGKQ